MHRRVAAGPGSDPNARARRGSERRRMLRSAKFARAVTTSGRISVAERVRSQRIRTAEVIVRACAEHDCSAAQSPRDVRSRLDVGADLRTRTRALAEAPDGGGAAPARAEH